jgi:hypothetical protein
VAFVNSRLVLIAGFGGLLQLMAFSGVDAINALEQIQTANDTSGDDLLLQHACRVEANKTSRGEWSGTPHAVAIASVATSKANNGLKMF